MEFFEEGDEILCLWKGDDKFTGFDSVLHGGIQATLMDEIASWVVFTKLQTSGFTKSLTVDYIQTVFIRKGDIRLRASLKEMKKNIAHVAVSLFDGEQNKCTEGIVQYFTLPEKIARKKLNYPGIENFYE